MTIKLSRFILLLLLFLFFLSSFACQKTVAIKYKKEIIPVITYKNKVCDLLNYKTLPFSTNDVKNARPFDKLREGTILEVED